MTWSGRGKPGGYKHTTPYQSEANRIAVKLMVEGPLSAYALRRVAGWASTGGPGNLRALAEFGVCERVDEKRPYNEKRYVLTAYGRELAIDWGLLFVLRRGECCEAAIFGIEGDHDPFCARPHQAGQDGAGIVPVGARPRGSDEDQGMDLRGALSARPRDPDVHVEGRRPIGDS